MRVPWRQGGFTLIELVVSIVVIGIAVAAVLLPMDLSTARSADPMIQHQAVAIAEAYMEEILLRPFADPDGLGGETRQNYDDIFDYHNLSDAGARDQNNALISGLGEYLVSVTVQTDGTLGPAGQQVPSAQAARIAVRVQNGSMVDFTLVAYRTLY